MSSAAEYEYFDYGDDYPCVHDRDCRCGDGSVPSPATDPDLGEMLTGPASDAMRGLRQIRDVPPTDLPAGLAVQAVLAAQRLASYAKAQAVYWTAALTRPGVAVPVSNLLDSIAHRADEHGRGCDIPDELIERAAAGHAVFGDPAWDALLAQEAASFAEPELSAALLVAPITAHRRIADAQELLDELPATFQALEEGRIEDIRARVIAETTRHIDAGLRRRAEQLILDRAERGMTPGDLGRLAAKIVADLDPEAAGKRADQARARRGTGVRPLGDDMARFTADLAVEDAALTEAVLDLLAAAIPSECRDGRGVSQVRADIFADLFTTLADTGLVDLRGINPNTTDDTGTTDDQADSDKDPHPDPTQPPADPTDATADPPDGTAGTDGTEAEMDRDADTTNATAESDEPDVDVDQDRVTGVADTDRNDTGIAEPDRNDSDQGHPGQPDNAATDVEADGPSTFESITGPDSDAPDATQGSLAPPADSDDAEGAVDGETDADADASFDPDAAKPGGTDPDPDPPPHNADPAEACAEAVTATAIADPGRERSGPSAAELLARLRSIDWESRLDPDCERRGGLLSMIRLPAGVRVNLDVTVALSTLAGYDDLSARLAGLGVITADTARALAKAAGTVRILLTNDPPGPPNGSPPGNGAEAGDPDRPREPRRRNNGGIHHDSPDCGTVLDFGRTAYRPPASVIDRVDTRDQRCRFPGCPMIALRCDHDHRITWDDGGATCPCDLDALCRFHHRIKTFTAWSAIRDHSTNTLTWTSPLGRVHPDRPAPDLPTGTPITLDDRPAHADPPAKDTGRDETTDSTDLGPVDGEIDDSRDPDDPPF